MQQAAGSRQAAGKQQASSKQVSSRSKKGICKLFLFLVVGMQCCDRAFAALQCRENFSVCLFLLSYYCVSLSSSLLLLTSTVTYKLSQILNVGLFMTRELTEVCRQQFLRKSSKKAHKNYYSDYCVLHKIEGQWRRLGRSATAWVFPQPLGWYGNPPLSSGGLGNPCHRKQHGFLHIHMI